MQLCPLKDEFVERIRRRVSIVDQEVAPLQEGFALEHVGIQTPTHRGTASPPARARARPSLRRYTVAGIVAGPMLKQRIQRVGVDAQAVRPTHRASVLGPRKGSST